MRTLLFALFLSLPSQYALSEVTTVPGESQSPITLTVGELTATFADNQAYGEHHRNRYNGIAELLHPSASGNLFVPSYAGFNLEHFFGGDFLEELFEPREHPMVLWKVDDQTVKLYQPPDSRSKVESTHTFRMVPPHYIDIEVELTYHDLTLFRHGYAGTFWASYINKPESKSMHFWGTHKERPEPHWAEWYSPRHGYQSTHLHVDDVFEPFFVDNFNTTLANHFSDFRYIDPFYYGIRQCMVFAIFFDRTEGVRFSQSPTGGGEGNPAWDHYFLIRDPKVGQPYSYRGRLMYKPYVSAEDIRTEYQAWRSTHP